MLPALPTTFGRLTDVFISALGAITGIDNRLGFKPTRRACVIMVDGLGAVNLKAAAGHAPFLNSALARTKNISCAFPSTTATSLTSFATGLSAGSHSLIGYQLFDRKNSTIANLLTGWSNQQVPLEWQPDSTVTERALAHSVTSFVIGLPEYENSGFTQVTMRGAKYLPAKTISDRFEAAERLLNGSDDCLVYLYVPELDQAAHAFGASSIRWLERVEELDSQVRKLAQALRPGAGLALTADHGIVDVPHSDQLYLDEAIVSDFSVQAVGGDPRVNFVYLADSKESEPLAGEIRRYVKDFGWVLTRAEVEASKLYATLGEKALGNLPDVMVLARKRVAFYHRQFAKTKSLQMIGQHGSISHDELTVPLISWGDWA